MNCKPLLIAAVLIIFVQWIIFAQTDTPQSQTETPEYYYNRGKDFFNKGNYQQAIEEYNKAIQLKPDYAVAKNDLGVAYYSSGDYTNAERCFLDVLSINEKTLGKENSSYATSLNNLGNLYLDIGDYAKAERYYLDAASIYEKALGKDNPSYAISLNNLGELYRTMGDYIKAERYYLDAVSIFEKSLGKDHPFYATLLNNLGLLYHRMGDFAKAERYFQEAISIREKTLGKDHPDYAVSLSNLGMLYHRMGDYAKAERYYLDAASIFEKSLGKDNPSYASSLNNLGVLYGTLGNNAKAERYFQEAISIREKTLGKDHPDYAQSLNNLGALYDDIGTYAKAERYYLDAASILERTLGKGHPDYARPLDNLGNLYHHMGDYAKAERYYLDAASIREKTLGKGHPDYATSLNNLGTLYLDMGDYAKAERYCLDAAGIFEKALGKDHPQNINLRDNLYTLYLAKREYNQAITFKQEVCQLNTDQVNRNFSFLSEQQRSAYWNNSSKFFEDSYSLSWFNPVPESNVLNYNNALFSKGLLLRTTNAVRDAIYSSGDQTLISKFEGLRSLRQQIDTLNQGEKRDEAYIQSLEQQAEDLDKSITQASSAFREFQADLKLGWKDVQNSLQPNEAAIEFVSFRIFDKKWTNTTQYAALVLRPGMEAPAWIPLCEEGTLTELFGRINGILPKDQPRYLYNEYGADLYNSVWQPLEKILEGVTTIYYSPSGLLHKVAFNAIPVKGDTNTRLMDKYNLQMVSGTREVVQRQRETTQKPGSAVVYGGLEYNTDADTMQHETLAYAQRGTSRNIIVGAAAGAYEQKASGGIEWPDLPFTGAESKSIDDLLIANKIPADLYSGARGNKESFMALNSKKTAVIHLATHGFFNQDIKKNYDQQQMEQMGGSRSKANENPLLRSGLVLAGANTWIKNPVADAESGILLSEEVAQLNLLGADLVVMSACETALGEVDNSEGVFGLQRAFKLAGAGTLIMSLWQVDDEATSLLLTSFYQTWLSGKTKQEAFKEAQRSLRANEKYSSPYYWAAFVMMD